MDKKATKSVMVPAKRQIAIVRGIDVYDDEYNKIVAASITDWDEVTEEEYEDIRTWIINKAYSYTTNSRYHIIERRYYEEEREEILTTVKQAKKKAEKYRLEEEQRKKNREAKRAEKQKKKEAKTLEEKKALFNKLKEEFETKKL